MTKVVAYIVFWLLFSVGSITSLYALFLVGFRGYLKIRDMIINKKIEKLSK